MPRYVCTDPAAYAGLRAYWIKTKMSAPKTAAIREFSIQAPPGMDLPAIVNDVIAILHVEYGIVGAINAACSTDKRVRVTTRFMTEEEVAEVDEEPSEEAETRGDDGEEV